MKKTVPIIFTIVSIFLVAWPIPARAQVDYDDYLSIKPGDTSAFTYTVIPNDQSHQSILSVDLSLVITTIEDINSTTCNVTYTVNYKNLVDGIPKDQAVETTRTIYNPMNSSDYVRNATSPWGLFFTNNNDTTTNRTVNVPASANWSIGSGYITWGKDGVLDVAYFHTVIGGMGCSVEIKPKGDGGGGVPGYSTAIIIIVAVIPTTLLAYKITRKAHHAKDD